MELNLAYIDSDPFVRDRPPPPPPPEAASQQFDKSRWLDEQTAMTQSLSMMYSGNSPTLSSITPPRSPPVEAADSLADAAVLAARAGQPPAEQQPARRPVVRV